MGSHAKCVWCWLRKWLYNVSVEFSLKKCLPLILVGGVVLLADICLSGAVCHHSQRSAKTGSAFETQEAGT
jgi:hypothetical protein